MTAVSVSPDSTQLAYSTCEYPDSAAEERAQPPAAEDYQYEIALVASGGGHPMRLTTSDGYQNYPAWSPDGTRIAFLSAERTFDHLAQLFVMAPDGSEWRTLAPDLYVENHPPQWSPDGEWLAFVARDEDREQALYVVREDGTELRRLAEAASSPVSWSPDGQRLAFAQPEDATVALVTIAADGSDAQRVATIDGWQPPYGDPDPAWAQIGTLAWSPAGTQILISVDDRVPAFVVDLDTGGRTEIGIVQVYVGSGKTTAFQGVRAAAWSPDGARIALVGPTLAAIVSADGGSPQGLAELVEVDGASRWQPLNARVLAPPVDATGCGAGVAVADPAANAGLVADCAALLEVQQALADGAALNWSVDRPMSEWDGLTLGGAPLRVHVVSLGEQQPTRPPPLDLRRQLPAALARLTELRTLRLTHSRLTGSIPAELTKLGSLETLDLSVNQLTGPIPAELGQLANLEVVSLSENRFTGPIPREITRLANLEMLDLSDNRLTGPILPELGQQSAMRELKLHSNQLSGPIPTELSRLTSLQVLSLGGNRLSGPIPPEIGDLTSLELLSLAQNQLTGALPAEFGQLANLVMLFLAENSLTGSIPAELGRLGNLEILDLSSNNLSGPVPSELGQIETLFSLRLGGNQFTGCIPSELLANVSAYSSSGLHDLGLPVCESAEL